MEKRIILVNIYYRPTRFGGATVVVEQLAKWLQSMGWKVLIVTSNESPITVYRYKIDGIDAISINCRSNEFLNVFFAEEFDKVLKSFSPDIVHFHAVQNLGFEMFNMTKKMNIPYVVTLHDHWWICDRQFMITLEGKYCFKDCIDVDECEKVCKVNKSMYNTKSKVALEILENSASVLVPSKYFYDFYTRDLFDKDKVIVNKNGINLPDSKYKKIPSTDGKIRFGFTGGPGPTKGLDLILDAFNKISNDNYELILVDAAININVSWYQTAPVIPGKVSIYDAYNQDTIDEFFANIDVLLFPSQCKESFGLTVREALVRDVWVIASECGGPMEDLIDGENGTVIPIGEDPKLLIEAIENCLNKKWDNYKNKYKSNVVTFEQQAKELSSILINKLNN